MSEIERRLPGISPRIEFRVYIPLVAGVERRYNREHAGVLSCTCYFPKMAVNINIVHFPSY
jgi:hypothetical protein